VSFCVASFYRFGPVADPPARRKSLAEGLGALGLRGTVILAGEGVNGTLAGPEEALEQGLAQVSAVAGPLRMNRARAGTMPFGRLKVKLRPEIVTMGAPGVEPARLTGTHVAPADWNALITAPDVVTIDTRNAHEVALGSFAGAVDPGIARFSDFPGWWRGAAPRLSGRRVAMFCTGGIRCEKATSLALQEGAAEVFHLEGGILRYLQEIAPEESLWRGACFVFDERVAVGPESGAGED
jgi:UPF0176 protein